MGGNPKQFLKSNREMGVIFCNFELPDVHGLKLLHQITQEKKFHETVIIMLLPDQNEEYQQNSLQLGADLNLCKPFAWDAIKPAIEEAAKIKRRKLEMENARVKVEIAVQITSGHKTTNGLCLELSLKECQIVSELELGIGSRVQFQLANDQSAAWFDPVKGMVSSTGRHADGTMAKIEYTTKILRSQGIAALVQQYMPNV
ncbi:MAG: response regulator [SAR324 cluster bacterium]|nr:response regulator [SAR324 cluster bacterium]